MQRFLYADGLRISAELDASGDLVSRFVYTGNSFSPDYMLKGGARYLIVKDQLGSPRLVVDSSTGTIAQALDYDEFGIVRQDTNPGFQPFGFAGGLYDPDTGLVRFGVRDYDPMIGRWTKKDPILFGGGDTNLYAYVGNDPINFVDPRGLQNVGALWAGAQLGEMWLAFWAIIDEAKNRSLAYHDGRTLGNRDAMRHCMWQCLLANEFGPGAASGVGHAWEAWGSISRQQPYEESEMDIQNNICGRSYQGSENCEESCGEALGHGLLSTMDNDVKLTPFQWQPIGGNIW